MVDSIDLASKPCIGLDASRRRAPNISKTSRLGDIAIECGSEGVLFPSTRHTGGSNIVVFTQQLAERDEVTTYDPHGDLPRNQDSWRPQSEPEK